jgi:hypothetical protein
MRRIAFAIVFGFAPAVDAQRPLPQFPLVAELRIGAEQAGPAYEFTAISQVAARAGAVYVSQPNQQEIRMFDSTGRHLRTIGRRGGGPGEFDALQSFGLLSDTLWTIDSNLRRVTLFSPAGKLIATIPYGSIPLQPGAAGGFYFPFPLALMPGGNVLGFGGTTSRDIADGRVTAMPILRMTRTGRTLDTLGWVSLRNDAMIMRSARGISYRGQPFTDAMLIAYAPVAARAYVIDRTAATSSARASYTVTALRTNRDTAWSRRFAYTPVKLDAHVADSVRDRMRRAYRTRYTEQEVDRALFLPAFRTPVSAAIAADDGTLWLRREDGGDRVEYTVIGPDGNELARIVASARVRLKWVSRWTAWGEELNEDDVPVLVRYAVRRDMAR